MRISGRSPSLRHLVHPSPFHCVLCPCAMLAPKPACAVLQRYASWAATYMRELKLAIATLEGGVHRRVAPAAGSKLFWRGAWDISLHPQVTFLGTRSKRGSLADRRK